MSRRAMIERLHNMEALLNVARERLRIKDEQLNVVRGKSSNVIVSNL